MIRRTDGQVDRIVDHRDAAPDELDVNEVCTSIYAFRRDLLGPALRKLTTDNAQGEYYLTDVVEILVGDGHRVDREVASARSLLEAELGIAGHGNSTVPGADLRVASRQRHVDRADLPAARMRAHLAAEGYLLRDLERGVVHFAARRGLDYVLLCWNEGEDTVTHWHAIGEEGLPDESERHDIEAWDDFEA
mgnify:CR=1 FL=1